VERSPAADPLLSEIDWYGDTTFNRLQMPRFLLGWAELAKQGKSPEEVELIKQLAERCQGGVHLYLKFIGD
jgi:hypothetical protein